MAVILFFAEFMAFVSCGLLIMVAPFMCAIAWARAISQFLGRTSLLIQLTISLVFLLPVAIAFVAAEYTARDTVIFLQSDYWFFNSHPFWGILSLIGLIVLNLPKRHERLLPVLFTTAIALYVWALLGPPSFLTMMHMTSLVSPVLIFGYFANAYVTLTFFLASILRASKKISIYGGALSVIVSMICTFLVVVFPFRD